MDAATFKRLIEHFDSQHPETDNARRQIANLRNAVILAHESPFADAVLRGFIAAAAAGPQCVTCERVAEHVDVSGEVRVLCCGWPGCCACSSGGWTVEALS